MLRPGEEFTATIEKPVAGGRMLARHEGQVVLVAGTLPGERVRARVLEVTRGAAHAAVIEVLEPHAERRASHDVATWLYGPCGGNVYAHIAYEHQLALKRDVIIDAFGRIAKCDVRALATPLSVVSSPERGYRMRARLHLRRGRIGLFREGSHRLCDAASTGQLLPQTERVLSRLTSAFVSTGPRRSLSGPGHGRLLELTGDVELAENIEATERVFHFELDARLPTRALRAIAAVEGITGFSASVTGVYRSGIILGNPHVSDRVRVGTEPREIHLHRHVRSFFQGNRYLLAHLVSELHARVPQGPVVDLYAGVGLFGVTLAAAGKGPVVAVERDPFSGHDLKQNAAVFGDAIHVISQSAEEYLASSASGPSASTLLRSGKLSVGGLPEATVIVDPPRAGLSKPVTAALVAARASRVVYVSCDVATLARDARLLMDGGYRLENVTAFDLFPNTAHIETLAVFTRA